MDMELLVAFGMRACGVAEPGIMICTICGSRQTDGCYEGSVWIDLVILFWAFGTAHRKIAIRLQAGRPDAGCGSPEQNKDSVLCP